MARYLIEVPHETEMIACARAVKLLLETGSHFITHADFGCKDNDHRAWITLEADSKEQALMAVPSSSRANARITGLNKFSIEDMDDLLRHHGG